MDTNSDSLILNIFQSNPDEERIQKSRNKSKKRNKFNNKSNNKTNNNNNKSNDNSNYKQINDNIFGHQSHPRGLKNRDNEEVEDNEREGVKESVDKLGNKGDRHVKADRDGKRDRQSGYGKFNSRLFDSTSDQMPTISLFEAKSRFEPVFSSHKYSELSLHPYLIKCLSDRLSISQTTAVQQNSIPVLMTGADALIKSMTGSGKTLAFAIPIIQDLQSIEPNITRSDGIYALIVVPTRELAAQCFECFSVLCQSFKRLVCGYLCGGEKKKSEKARIRKGLNILVTTPGRLLDHMQSTDKLQLNRVKWLVIDEADRLLEQGFEESVQKVVEHLANVCPVRPQTVLVSATLTDEVQRLAGMSLSEPRLIDISDDQRLESFVLPENLTHHYIVVAPKLRLITLSALLMDKCSLADSKALVFTSCQDVVDFHYIIFQNVFNKLLQKCNQKEINFYQLHGNMDQHKRRQVFHQFRAARNGVLFCTDVAARGLDLPQVDWIIQLNCAPKSEDYVHRVGRTARIGNTGNAVQFVLTTETKFLELLQKDLNINLSEMQLKECLKSLMFLKFERTRPVTPEEYATQLQISFETGIGRDEDMLGLAKRAYLSYIRSYATYPKAITEALPFKSLHLGHLAKSFALQESPKALGAFGFRLKQQSIDLQQKYNNYNKRIVRINRNNDNSNNDVLSGGESSGYASAGEASGSEPAMKRAKYSQMPSEMRTSEFGGQLVTKPGKKNKKRTHFYS